MVIIKSSAKAIGIIPAGKTSGSRSVGDGEIDRGGIC